MVTIRIPTWLAIIASLAVVIPIAIATIERLSVGARRHALSYPEASKDDFLRLVRAACQRASLGAFFVPPGASEYKLDDGDFGYEAYRYLVFRDSLLRDEQCLTSVLSIASQTNYPMKIEFVSRGATRTGVFYSNGSQ